MNECEETEEGVHPSETPLCGQHDNQTKAQRLGSLESLSSDLKKNVTISDDSSDSRPEQLLKPDSQVLSKPVMCIEGPLRAAASLSALGSLESLSSDLKKNVAISDDSSDSRRDHKSSFRSASAPVGPDFSYSPASNSEEDIATDNDDSVLSSDSGLGSGESSSSDLKKDSFQPSDSRCVSWKEKARSFDNDIDFKKNPDHKCVFKTASLPTRPDFSESLSSRLLKDVAAADRYSVLSSDSGISLERKVSSGSSCESSKKEKEKTTPPNTQELDVGSSAGIET